MAAILIKVKLLHLSNGSTCCREICYDDTCYHGHDKLWVFRNGERPLF